MGKYYSDTLEKGIQLLYFQSNAEKYPEALKLIEQACENNEPDAYYVLARCHFWGDGNASDDSMKARSLSAKGMALGSAMCALGADRASVLSGMKAALRECNGTYDEILKDAAEKVTRQAEAGNPVAQYAIGLYYFWGDVEHFQKWDDAKSYEKLEQQNAAEGLRWFLLGARQGHIPSFRNAYLSQVTGENGVIKNINAALSLAEELKDVIDVPLQLCRVIGDGYESLKMKDAQKRWYQRAVDRGDAEAMNCLGLAYLDDKNYDKALEWFRAGGDKGDDYCLYNLGRCYENGWGMKKDCVHAAEYYQKAADSGNEAAKKKMTHYKKNIFGKWGFR